MPMPEDPHPEAAAVALRVRFMGIMGRHLRPTDNEFNDADFISAVIARYLRERRQPIVDPNE